jgi:hypothetical protein
MKYATTQTDMESPFRIHYIPIRKKKTHGPNDFHVICNNVHAQN